MSEEFGTFLKTNGIQHTCRTSKPLWPQTNGEVERQNRSLRSKIPELTKCEYIDSEARDRDAEMKQRRTDYANERRGAQENSLAPGDHVLVKQRKENKLSTTFKDAPYKVTNKYGNEVAVTSPEGVNYKRNVTDVKKYLKASNGPDQQSTGNSVAGGTAESEVPEFTPKAN